MSVSPEEVRKIATLSRLQLADEEVSEMSVQLSSILSHMEALGRVDVESAPPLATVADGAAPLRNEGSEPDALRRQPSELAPDWRDGFFVVPRLAALDAEALGAEGGSA